MKKRSFYYQAICNNKQKLMYGKYIIVEPLQFIKAWKLCEVEAHTG